MSFTPSPPPSPTDVIHGAAEGAHDVVDGAEDAATTVVEVVEDTTEAAGEAAAEVVEEVVDAVHDRVQVDSDGPGGFRDVAVTPAAPGPIPIPFPNVPDGAADEVRAGADNLLTDARQGASDVLEDVLEDARESAENLAEDASDGNLQVDVDLGTTPDGDGVGIHGDIGLQEDGSFGTDSGVHYDGSDGRHSTDRSAPRSLDVFGDAAAAASGAPGTVPAGAEGGTFRSIIEGDDSGEVARDAGSKRRRSLRP